MKGDTSMSIKEINQIDIFEKLSRKEIKQKEASDLLKISIRQVKRKLHDYKKEGAKSLIHKGRGKQSNNKITQEKLDQVIKIIKEKYCDFGPTLAHEKLVEQHGFKMGLTTVRKQMIEEGLWKSGTRKKAHVHQLRERRSCFGELVQLDGSPHAWFEDRAPTCNLNVMIDDATGVLVLQFSEAETTQDHFKLAEDYFNRYGLPLALYSDKHSIFKINHKENDDFKKPEKTNKYEGLTQFGRAMAELNIELICANTPQAKGRVERANLTLQDRLVKELRLRNISSIEEGNKYLPEFTKSYINKFSIKPKSNINMHKKLNKNVDLSSILCIKELRTLSKNLTCQYDNIVYQIKPKKSAYSLRKMIVEIRIRHDKKVTIVDNRGNLLDYTVLKKKPKRQVLHSKELNNFVDQLKIKQAQLKHQKKNPWESDPNDLTDNNYFYKPNGAV